MNRQTSSGRGLGEAWERPGRGLGEAWARPGARPGRDLLEHWVSMGEVWTRPGPGLSEALSEACGGLGGDALVRHAWASRPGRVLRRW